MDLNWSTAWLALRQRWHLAAALLAGVALLNPSPVPAELLLAYDQARLAQAAGEFALAAQALETALSVEPVQPSIRQASARLWLQAGQPANAQRVLSAAPPASPPGQNCLSWQIEWSLAGLESSAAILDSWPANCQIDSDLLRDRLRQAVDDGRLEAALPLAKAYAALAPRPQDAHLQLGQLLAITKPADAVATLRQSLTDDPATSAAAINLIRAIEDAQIEPSAAFRLAQVGQALARNGQWGLAKAAFESALELDPDYVEALAYHGLALDQTGLDGLADLQKARALAPAAPLPASFLGLHLLQTGEAVQAIRHLQAAVALEPSNPAYLAQLGAAQAAAGDLGAARVSYEAAVAVAPADSDFWRLLAEFSLRYEVDLAGLALPAARQAYLLEPSPAHADLLGYAHYLNGSYQVSARLLTHAVAADPSLASAQYHLGLLQLDSGGPSAARASLQRAQALDTDGQVGALAARTLERFDR
ncbi:MAG TPA: tetratricopeptide repeat protein [Anaerolineales bacterium]